MLLNLGQRFLNIFTSNNNQRSFSSMPVQNGFREYKPSSAGVYYSYSTPTPTKCDCIPCLMQREPAPRKAPRDDLAIRPEMF